MTLPSWALSDSAQEHLDSHNALGDGYNESHGVQYVSLDGSASNHGRSWAAPKSTIADALGELSGTGSFPGARVVVGVGAFTVNEVDVPNGVDIVGQGRHATSLKPVGTYGLRLSGATAQFNKIENVVFQDDGAEFSGRAVWIQNQRSVTLRDVRFHHLSESWAGSSDIDAAPCAIYLDGSLEYTDWHNFDGIDISGCYRGIVNAGNSHFKLSNSVLFYQLQECIYNLRRDVGFGTDAGGNIELVNVSMRSQLSDYTLYSEFDPTGGVNAFGNVILMGVSFERAGSSGVARHHVYHNLNNLVSVGCRFDGGSAVTGNPSAIHFGDDASGGRAKIFTSISGGFGAPEMSGNTAGQADVTA